MNGYFTLKNSVSAVADKRMMNGTVKNLWNGFCFKDSKLDITEGENCTFSIGDTEIPNISENKDYALCVDGKGIAVKGKDYPSLMRGFMSLIMKIEYSKNELFIRFCNEESEYSVLNRMIHICILPETDFYFAKKLIRLAGVCQYTHIVIEFWGMLKYDCLKELSWENAFTKEQAKELIKECRELGMEPIPMFNQLGHATASRVCYGKHVVLDQNPKLKHLFSPDGWVWDIKSQEVFDLLKKVRLELYEVFGEGEYVHIGCDEAYYITSNEEYRKELPVFLKKLTEEVEREGRKPMIWMDMLLEEGLFKDCYTVGKKGEVEFLRNSLAKSTVFVDWQYDSKNVPIPSLVSLKDCGHDVIGAPWFDEKNYVAHIDTVKENGLYGIMLTTWHTLKLEMHSVLGCAKKCGVKTSVWSEHSGFREETATLLRKISFDGNNYASSGWSKEQIEV